MMTIVIRMFVGFFFCFCGEAAPGCLAGFAPGVPAPVPDGCSAPQLLQNFVPSGS